MSGDKLIEKNAQAGKFLRNNSQILDFYFRPLYFLLKFLVVVT